ncbi:MAG: conjugal transfer protein TraF [Elusimicrobia bacterium]|nr:conjugal transfer protein TraF [Elusimicrobiota bacterium]
MKKTLAALVAVLIAAAPAGAAEWLPLGPRALGMGGAGVALAQGPLASYWNPAALGRPTMDSYGIQIPVTAHAGLTGDVIAGANDLKNVQSACPGGADCTPGNITKALNELNHPGNGARIDVGTGANLKIGKFALFVDGFADVGAVPSIDTVNTSTRSTDSTYVGKNTSALILKGARIVEGGIGYGHELPFVPGLYLGGNLKIMNAQVGYASQQIITSNNGNSDILSNFKNGAKTSSNFGVDAGALWDLHRTFDWMPLHPRVGLVGRNLNDPKFDLPAAALAAGETGKYSVNPQVRFGASISPFHWWNIAADVDMTRNLTPVDNVATRNFGVGTEVNVFNRSWINIPLRVGLSKNLAESASGTMFSAGAGLNFLHFMIDASGSVSPKTIDTQTQGQSTKIPRELAAAVQLSLLFGGSEQSDSSPSSAASAAPAAPPAAPASVAPPQPTPAQVQQVQQDADKAQKELDQQKPQ